MLGLKKIILSIIGSRETTKRGLFAHAISISDYYVISIDKVRSMINERKRMIKKKKIFLFLFFDQLAQNTIYPLCDFVCFWFAFFFTFLRRKQNQYFD